jgi:hypothetical protein
MKSLANSRIDRDNILNNTVAIREIEKELNLGGVNWNNQLWFTKEYASSLYGVDIRTIESQISKNIDEITQNGYVVLTSKQLQDLKKFATEIGFGNKTRKLALLSFRTILNLSMLLQNSKKATEIRTKILDIVIGVLSEKTGGHRLYINQRDPNFLDVAYSSDIARREFTQALNLHVDMGIYKYEYFTNQVYKTIFLENAKKYQQILRLKNKANLRDTMYTEILTNIASIESGLAYDIEAKAAELNRLLSKDEVDELVFNLTDHPSMHIYIEQARSKMASRDLCFRDAYHSELQNYISSVDPDDFERFLGEKSKSLEKQIEEHIDIFKRLKDK